jgi:hypothetical protein
MATERYYTCKCSRDGAGRLFDALLKFSQAPPPVCEKCGRIPELHVVFHFGLNAGVRDCKVLGVLLPRRRASWVDGKRRRVISREEPTDLSPISQAQRDPVSLRLNQRPRKTLLCHATFSLQERSDGPVSRSGPVRTFNSSCARIRLWPLMLSERASAA